MRYSYLAPHNDYTFQHWPHALLSARHSTLLARFYRCTHWLLIGAGRLHDHCFVASSPLPSHHTSLSHTSPSQPCSGWWKQLQLWHQQQVISICLLIHSHTLPLPLLLDESANLSHHSLAEWSRGLFSYPTSYPQCRQHRQLNCCRDECALLNCTQLMFFVFSLFLSHYHHHNLLSCPTHAAMWRTKWSVKYRLSPRMTVKIWSSSSRERHSSRRCFCRQWRKWRRSLQVCLLKYLADSW